MYASLKIDGEKLVVAGLRVKDFMRLDTYIIPRNLETGKIDYTSKKGKHLTEIEKAALDKVYIDDKLIKILAAIQTAYANHTLGITDHGGYRRSAKVGVETIDLNKAVGGAGGSQHKYGRGADIWLKNKTTGEYLDTAVFAVAAEKIMNGIGIRGGVGIYAGHWNYIHVDSRGSWSAWFESYAGNGIHSQGGRYVALRKGHRAAGVKLIQRKLISLGYTECDPSDGIFGVKTYAALKRFQKDHKLKVDGIYGKGSNKILGALPW